MKKIFKLKNIVIAIAIIIFICELFLRVFYHEQLRTRVTPLVYQPDSLYGYSYIPNIEGEISLPSIKKKFHINNIGYYGPDVNVVKNDSVYRIICMGYSNTSGIYTDCNLHYPLLMDSLYKAQAANVEVWSAGIDGGGNGVAIIKLIENELIHYNPDMIILDWVCPLRNAFISREVYKEYLLQYHQNNEESRNKAKQQVDYLESHKFYTCLYDISYIVRFFVKNHIDNMAYSKPSFAKTYLKKKSETFDWKTDVLPVKQSVQIYQNLNRFLTEKGIKLVLPTYNDFKDRKEFTEITGLPIYYVNPQLDKTMVLEHDAHLNYKGHYTLAITLLTLVNDIRNNGLEPNDT